MNTQLNLLPTRKKKLPVIKQVQFAECGHACVAMISNYHGHDVDLNSLRLEDEPSINGSNLLDIIRLFERLKLTTRALRIDVNELNKVPCPAVLHWNLNHFVVLQSVGTNYAIIHDPAVGRRKVSLKELSASFTGIVLEVEKADDFAVVKSANSLNLWDVFKSVEGLKNSLFVLLILSLTIEVFTLINPLFLQYITDNVATTHSLNNLYVVAFGFILLTVCHTFTEYMRSHFVVYLTNRVSEHFTSGVMKHLLRLPFAYFERRHKGDILSRFHSINEIQNKITTDSINTLLDGVVILLALIIMLIYSGQLTVVVMIALAGYSLIRVLTYTHVKSQTEISIGEHANVGSKFLEIIQSIMPIKLFSKETTLFKDWKNLYIRGMNADIKISQANILYSTANIFLFNLEHILVITLGALLVMKNQFSIGMLVAFLAYRQTLVFKATSFIQKIYDYKLVAIQVERVADILLHPAETEDNGCILKQGIRGDIKVCDLEYKYSANQQSILHKINFHIKPAEKVVITGPSGIGKTTLLKIMLGLIAPTQGSVLIDDISLDKLGSKQYRSVCASVMQDDSLISGSVLDNITFMDNTIDIEKVYQSAKSAQIHEDILKMTMGYETLIGDMGSSLSGGQKQRVLLARALYKNPKILFLDEATSHLDVETEIKINQALKQLQITQVVIAHREESIKMADRIIDLGRGV